MYYINIYSNTHKVKRIHEYILWKRCAMNILVCQNLLPYWKKLKIKMFEFSHLSWLSLQPCPEQLNDPGFLPAVIQCSKLPIPFYIIMWNSWTRTKLFIGTLRMWTLSFLQIKPPVGSEKENGKLQNMLAKCMENVVSVGFWGGRVEGFRWSMLGFCSQLFFLPNPLTR